MIPGEISEASTGAALRCSACGRISLPGPNGLETTTYLGMQWCTRCAAVREATGGSTYVDQPSPGRVFEGAEDDPLTAMWDCYSFKPKKRILVKDARAEIQLAWETWAGSDRSDLRMLEFFQWLQRHRPYFLTFRCKHDPWQSVHSWLTQHERNIPPPNKPLKLTAAGFSQASGFSPTRIVVGLRAAAA